MKKTLVRILSVLIFLAVWQIAAIFVDSSLILPGIPQTGRKLVELFCTPHFYREIAVTSGRVLAAFCISFFSGCLIGFLSGTVEQINDFIHFPLVVLQSTPVAALILLLMFVLRSDSIPVVVAVMLTLPVMINGVGGSFCKNENQKKLLEMAEIFRFSKKQTIKYILVPQIFPAVKSSSVTIFAVCWKVIVAGEILTVPKSCLGTRMIEAQIHLESSEVYSLVLVIVVLSYLFSLFLKSVFNLAEKKAVFRESVDKSEFEKACSQKNINSAVKGKKGPEIKIEGLNLSFGEKTIFEDYNFTAPRQKLTAITAPSGFGKTTLLNYISKNYNCSYMFQESRLLENFSVLENIAVPLINQNERESVYCQIAELLEIFELKEKAFSPVQNLSGGEKQRVSLIRAVLFDADVLLLDEPFSSIDFDLKERLIEYLKKRFEKTGQTVLFVTHDRRDAELFGA